MKINCEEAPEPSQVLWHNRFRTPAQRLPREICVAFLVILFLFAMFITFIWFKKLTVGNLWRYPDTINCDIVDSIFESSNGDMNYDKYQEYA